MSDSYLWVVNNEGIPYRIREIAEPECLSDCQWLPEPIAEASVSDLVATPRGAFAIDSSGALYIFLLNSHIAVRKNCVVNANQRWYPIVGWSRPLPTDPSAYCNEHGESVSMSDWALPSEGWRWEEPWYIDSDVRKHDKEGWEYSFSFHLGTKDSWKPAVGSKSFVRRRQWRRHARYAFLQKWIQVPTSSDLICIGLTCGGFDAGNFSYKLYVLADNGEIYRRRSITFNDPEGIGWEKLPRIAIEGHDEAPDVVQICCSPSGMSGLAALTWDGQLFLFNDSAQSWTRISTPNLPLIQFSIGTGSLWASSVQGQVWMARLEPGVKNLGLSNLKESSFLDVGQGYSRFSVSAKDQVFCISATTNSLFHRTGTTAFDPAGKTFVKMVARVEGNLGSWNLVSASGCQQNVVPAWWTSDSVYLKTNENEYKSTEWRHKILNDLNHLNEETWNIFNRLVSNTEAGAEDDPGVTSARGAALSSDAFEGCWNIRCKLELPKSKNGTLLTGWVVHRQEAVEFRADTGPTCSIAFKDILSALPLYEAHPCRFGVYVMLAPATAENTIRVMLTEEAERDKLMSRLEIVIRDSVASSLRHADNKMLWTISMKGTLRCHFLSEMTGTDEIRLQSLDRIRALAIPGRFEAISAGADRVVWALTGNGEAYVLSDDYDPLNAADPKHWTHQQSVEEKFTLHEYQKYAIFRGFMTFNGQTKGIYAFMDKWGAVAGKYSRLPSKDWSWMDSEWRQVAPENGDEEGWRYAEKLEGPYDSAMKKGRARRRIWERRARFQVRSPWIPVTSPKLKRIEVQKQTGDRILVMALTNEGHLLLRQGVSRKSPQGFAWKEIMCDYPLVNITISSPLQMFATSKDGRFLRRECSDPLDFECVGWSELHVKKAAVLYDSDMVSTTREIFCLFNNQLYRIDLKTETLSFLCDTAAVHISIDGSGTLYLNGSTQVSKVIGPWRQVTEGKGRRVKVYYVVDATTAFVGPMSHCAFS